ncbi:NAD(P)/FAD-dependent oxidoreductase [Pelagovum pacificum]|uniref:FAD-binding oxidoreductase n=1 Tax=Pelagovum pacificum TaxID=2588711 RepID=A0A5C5GHV4_9RHOB|nr:FAD-dependent oxidoreductase [Pelagovum pacificum]QQA43160.1 FAD-binding oxidoreductase [Pelagovum pacificum]TNY33697.1 FAD-binding oxidoreductase [Pelagovum pacificum]
MATPDLTVLGAGVFGLSVAYACALRGARVRVIDPAGVASGASGGVVGALAPHVPENWNPKKAFQLESLLMGEDFWAGVAERSGVDPGYARSGRIQPLADDRAAAIARDRASGAEELWQGRALWEVRGDACGWDLVSPTGLFVHDTLSARIHPRQATRALAGAVRALGGEVLPDGERTGPVVEATGWRGLQALGQETGRTEGVGVKGQAALLDLDAHVLPQLFVDGLHLIPHADGTLGVGSTTERDVESLEVDAALDALLERARELVPALSGAAVIERWSGMRPRSRSRAPVLGRHPLREGVFVANGGFKIGFGVAPLVGEVMADLVLEGRDEGIPEGFRVQGAERP